MLLNCLLNKQAIQDYSHFSYAYLLDEDHL